MINEIRNKIKESLIKDFKPTVLKIINESSMHNVPEGSESHFKVLIVSDGFKDIETLKRHKIIYKSLDKIMNQIHALSINCFDENEYSENPNILDSPNCANK
tara:strand:+ start:220 stop:525 length:306 start_codon:yes stop_codon:yes gene_type:complete